MNVRRFRNVLFSAVLGVLRMAPLAVLLFSGAALAMPAALAQDKPSPYGGYKKGTTDTTYGERRPVSSVAEARKVLREYFAKKNVKIGEIKEKDLYFEAEILDKSGQVIDTVIVDKRTGRIRSIY